MENETKKSKLKFGLIGFAGLVIILGFIAGIFGEFFTKYYLSNVSFLRDLYFTEGGNLGQQEIVIQAPKKVVIEQDLRLDQVKKEISPAILGIYRKKWISKSLLDKFFLPSEYLGQAVVLTSDGWLIASGDSLMDSSENLTIVYNQKAYSLDKIIKDPDTKTVFLKINAQNLPVIKLADFKNVTDGQHVFIYNSYLDYVKLVTIENKKYKPVIDKYDLLTFSQDLPKSIILNKFFSTEDKGAAVFNFEGEIIGILTGDNKAMPISYLNPIIAQVLKDEKIQRPYLGIYYVNLAKVSELSEADRQKLDKGALLLPNVNGKAILADSPLLNQLNKGDIITSIEGQNIDAENDLEDILLEYKSGQEIRLKYWHEEKENEISVILK